MGELEDKEQGAEDMGRRTKDGGLRVGDRDSQESESRAGVGPSRRMVRDPCPHRQFHSSGLVAGLGLETRPRKRSAPEVGAADMDHPPPGRSRRRPPRGIGWSVRRTAARPSRLGTECASREAFDDIR